MAKIFNYTQHYCCENIRMAFKENFKLHYSSTRCAFKMSGRKSKALEMRIELEKNLFSKIFKRVFVKLELKLENDQKNVMNKLLRLLYNFKLDITQSVERST